MNHTVNYTPEEQNLILSYINFNALLGLESNNFFKTPLFGVLSKADPFVCDALKTHGLFNQGFLGSVLHMLLVNPKGIFGKNSNYQQHIDNIDDKLNLGGKLHNIIDLRVNNYTNEKSNNIKFMNHIRNSVSHSNYTFENGYFIFKDENPRDKSQNIEFQIAHDDMGKLIQELNLAYQQIIKDIKKKYNSNANKKAPIKRQS